jgi:hypothetical protein
MPRKVDTPANNGERDLRSFTGFLTTLRAFAFFASLR